MAEFLTTSGIIYQIEFIIKEAKKKLVLVSPFVQINKMLLERLQFASDRGVQIILIYGKDDLKKSEKTQLESIQNLKIYFYQNLHAKCYFNEKMMVITSMNLYEFSERNNREMGILINKDVDSVIFKEAVEETFSIIKSATEIESKKQPKPVEVIFPLKVEDLEILHNHFETNYNHCTVNSSPTYVYCKDLLPFGDVMIREGFEIRLYYNLYSEKLLINKLERLYLKNLKYEYETTIDDKSISNTRILFVSKNATDLNALINDYDMLQKKIIAATKNVSHKRRTTF